ncbi:hypothetical protein VT98_11033 [Candidatus Electrothrix communis]|uniref:Uncharacterized protein n=1 Tax=Candidatus Electrothrix communis TaxID=1859133 RepID=A0A444J739_9BACT|nr:hypothetical protein VT98_11033 [Candidatus Electrothrix communis]
MEHSVPKAIVERLVKYAEYVEKCPKGGSAGNLALGITAKTNARKRIAITVSIKSSSCARVRFFTQRC